jgi:hypothetical protein
MGKKWDASGIAYDQTVWSECLRVLKPGGHLLAFGGTRTYHRMTVAIEDAGFEIRDSIHWLYGSGFPKSLDVSKAIDKRGGASADFATFRDAVREAMERNNVTRKTLNDALGNHMLSHYLTAGSQPAVPNLRDYRIIRDTVGLGSTFDALFHDEAEREVIEVRRDAKIRNYPKGYTREQPELSGIRDITAPATDAARTWDGWGTALKPAHEPIVLARKPLNGTVAANVMAYGTGALNIDATRIGSGPVTRREGPQGIPSGQGNYVGNEKPRPVLPTDTVAGRWPANLILTHSPDCQQTGTTPDTFGGGAKGSSGFCGPNYEHDGFKGRTVEVATWNCVAGCPVAALNTQSGETSNPSRFFTTTEWDPEYGVPFLYVAKPSRRERNAGLDGMPERTLLVGAAGHTTNPCTDKPVVDRPRANFHPTVKPVALMRHLVRLVTPPGGTVLDPFLGSGTTAVAATLEGFAWIGCELTDDYLPIIEARVAWAEQNRPQPDLTLFGEPEC